MQKTGFVWGNGHEKSWHFSRTRRPQTIRFSGGPYATNAASEKISEKALLLRGEEKILNAVSNKFNFCENDCNSAKNNELLARSIFSSSANFGLLITNDDTLES